MDVHRQTRTALQGTRWRPWGWTPWRVLWLNRALRVFRWLGNPAQPWLINGRWEWFKDGAKSDTLRIVYHEVLGGFYDPIVPLRPGDTVLDLGGHVGMFTIPLARRHPQVRFIVYEPNGRNYQNLKANVQRAGLLNVECVNAGVWSHEVNLEEVHDEANTGSSRTKPANWGVRAYNLQTILTRHGIAWLRLLKLDVEGAEFAAIQSELDLAGVTSIIAEIHGDHGPADQMRAVLETVPRNRLFILPEATTLQDGQPWQRRPLGGAA